MIVLTVTLFEQAENHVGVCVKMGIAPQSLVSVLKKKFVVR